ncbi:hypothetical protein SAY86_011366 [Trapa natans]|uniref:Uncharacterized protein n=1 Tax=Trapa natans TaxID=22666 RepID=A0AAN7R6D9_TRANT|nr:hypothetical protein SAY86_011366 [Trapa natans]
MNYHSQRILAPGTLRKRKEREPMLPGTEVTAGKPPGPAAPTEAASQPALDNRILAGYLAYEFLTRGTLLGQKLNNGRMEAVNVSPPGPNKETQLKEMKENGSYMELACILKMEGVHIPGIVNPTELGRWIQM